MKRKALAAAGLLFIATTAYAHRIDEYLQATILSLEATQVHASMRLIPGIQVSPSVIAAIDIDHDGVFSTAEQQAYAQRVLADLTMTLDGQPLHPQLRAWSFPDPAQMRDGMGEIHIDYTADLPPGGSSDRTLTLANHHQAANSVYLMNAAVPNDPNLHIVAQRRNSAQSVYELDYQQLGTTTGANNDARSCSCFSCLSFPQGTCFSPIAAIAARVSGLQFAALFHLGMRHIAEGTDHLLFLLVLLLPAPLLAAAHRWAHPATVRQSLLHILGIVTAFTLGHTITLTLAAMNVVHVPERLIEVLIAVSILVSAIHALRPLFPGREAWIAAFFGLIHGLAFAATLGRLGLTRWDRLAGILAFNLGIETMQLLVVAAVLPSLLLLSRTRAYPVLRIGGTLFATAASLAWIVERLFDLRTPADTVVNALAYHALRFAAALLLISLACSYLLPNSEHAVGHPRSWP